MSFATFQEFFPEIAANETRSITIFTTEPGGPPAGKYYFIEMFCMDLECDCHNAMIGVYKENHDGKIQQVARLRFCWEDNKFYKSIGLDFGYEALPGVYPDFSSTNLDAYFIKHFGEMCYLNYSEGASIKSETEYAKRIKRHYELFKEHIKKNPQSLRNSKIGRNENCPCGSGKKNKKCCKLLS